MIPKSIFIPEMIKHWTERLENVSSEPLVRAWEQLCDAFNQHISGDLDGQDKWTVIQPPTGSGKTQGAILYSAITGYVYSRENHPGILIVTKRITEAKKIVEEINELAAEMHSELGKEIDYPLAATYHSQTNLKANELSEFPILVVTHRAYEMALSWLGEGSTIEGTWPLFNSYLEGNRKLTIVDEALDVVEDCSLNREHFGLILGVVNSEIRKEFPKEIECLNALLELIDNEEDAEGESREKILRDKPAVAPHTLMNFKGLRNALKQRRLDHIIGPRRKGGNPDFNKEVQDSVEEILTQVEVLWKSWVYYARFFGQHTLNTARLIVPPSAGGAVILDATASTNVVYELFSNVEIVTPPKGTRNYQNVTLNTSAPMATGKNSMTKKAKKLCETLVSDLNKRVPGRSVLVVTHMRVEPVLLQFKAEAQFDLNVAHWGNLDGSNEWRDCDVVVIFGVPFRPDHWSANTFMAFNGPQTNDWLNNPNARAYGKHSDIRKSLRTGQITTDVVQAINRVRCRRVTDADGNCDGVDIYMLLPLGENGTKILEGIIAEMPEISSDRWDYKGTGLSVRRDNSQKKGMTYRNRKTEAYRDSIVTYLQNENFMKVKASYVCRDLGIPSRTFSRLIQPVKDGVEEDVLVNELERIGVEYTLVQQGKRTLAYFKSVS